MKKKLIIFAQALLFVLGMVAAQACVIAPPSYGRPYYGPAYGYHWHHGY
jgi:hypothetical protein